MEQVCNACYHLSEKTKICGCLPDNILFLLLAIENSFVLEPMDTSVVIGQSVIMDCIPPPSVPPAVVLWSRDFSQLNGPRYQVLGNGSLKISEVQLEDGATFHCTATNTVSAVSRTSRGASLTAIGRVRAGSGSAENFQLSCGVW